MERRVKHLSGARIRKLPGGRDPVRLVEEFLLRKGVDSEGCLQKKSPEIVTWSVPITEDEELEITMEGINASPETTVYMGVNVVPVPLKATQEFLAAVLTVADTLIGAKLSLVHYDVVLSVTEYASQMSADELEYIFELLTRQKSCIADAIYEELAKL